ncbi:MAG TPA: flavin reductase family protein [Actinocrinis sp.]|nr:flavin reductase family protein [Actinocrinis sp.]
MDGRRRAVPDFERADVQDAPALPFRPRHRAEAAPDRQEVAAGEFREVLGNFATGVTVITTLDGSRPIGFTCQAFNSLSLDPPMVSFSVARASSTRPRIVAAGRFCVNVLAFDQHALCARFATREVDRFLGVDWWRSPGGNPVLDGSLAWIDCTVEAQYPAGDHTIVVGNVRSLAVQREAAPLVYHRGTFANCFPLAGNGALPRVC